MNKKSKDKEDRFIGVWVKPKDESLMAQVGRTDEDINIVATDILNKLKIEEKDIVLDVCCGNGLITKMIANHCKKVYGVDFSGILIETAKKENNGINVHYCLHDVLNIDKIFPENFFDKSYCYYSFQYFDYRKGQMLIEIMSKVTKPGGLILIDDIPDMRKRWNYYNNILKKMLFVLRRLKRLMSGNGQNTLGWWWHPNLIMTICDNLNVKCMILEQEKILPYSHYRFGFLIQNKKKS